AGSHRAQLQELAADEVLESGWLACDPDAEGQRPALRADVGPRAHPPAIRIALPLGRWLVRPRDPEGHLAGRMYALGDDRGERGQLLLARQPQDEVAGRQAQVEKGPQGVGHAGHHREVTSNFRQRVLGGETLIGAWASLDSPSSAELLGRAGLDWIVVDLEHGAETETSLLAHLYAIEVGGAAPLVRPPSGERLRIGRALDLGAAGIVVPRLDTVDQVTEAMTFLRYPPAGQRGVA